MKVCKAGRYFILCKLVSLVLRPAMGGPPPGAPMAPGDRLWAELGAEASGTQEGIGPRVRLCGREVLHEGLLAACTWSSRPSHPTAGWASDHRSAKPWMVGGAWTLVSVTLKWGSQLPVLMATRGHHSPLRPPHGREAEERPSCPLGAQTPPVPASLPEASCDSTIAVFLLFNYIDFLFILLCREPQSFL